MALKTNILVIAGWLLMLTSQAQDSIPLYSDVIAKQKAMFRPGLGIDLYQAVWVISSALQHDSPKTYAYPLSVTVYIPANSNLERERAVYINAGYVAYGGTRQRNIYQTGGSIHIRSGIELVRHNIILGYGGLLTGWTGQGSYYFKGPTFGDYQESIGTVNGLAVAGEGQVGAFVPISKRLSLRTVLRGSILYRLVDSQLGLSPAHLSGVDWQIDRRLGMGIGLQANLVFRL